MFILIAILIWSAAHIYVGWSVGRHIRRASRTRLLWGLLALNFCATIAALWLRRTVPTAPGVGAVQWVAYVGMGAFVLLWVLAMLRDVILLVVGAGRWAAARAGGRSAQPAQADAPADPGRRDLFLNAANTGMMGAVVLGSGDGFYQARKLADVVDVDVPVKGLARGLDGFRIVQITDVHVGPTIKRDYLQAVVDRVNALKPDLIAFTGDMIDGYVDYMRPEIQPIRQLSAPHGVYFVTGNHEYYWDALAWCDEIERCGLRVLNNAHDVLDINGAKLVVGGVTDYHAARHIPAHATDPHKALAGAPDGAFRLLMAHQPKSVWEAAKAGWDLQLSGHTHGGQFWPWNLLVGLAHPFTKGLHDYQGMSIYVSRGTGYWGPPLRLGVPSEITHITLRRV